MFYQGRIIRVEGVIKEVDVWGDMGVGDEPTYNVEVKMQDGNIYLVRFVEESSMMFF